MARSLASTSLLRRLFLSSFCMDAGYFMILAALPYKVLALGGGSLALGTVPAVASIVYIVMTQVAGSWSDRIGRHRLTLVGCVSLALSAVLAWRAPSLAALAAAMPLLGLGSSLYWPPIQAAVGDLSTGGGLGRNTGGFNAAWCSGKAFGYFACGLILARVSFGAAFLAGVVLVAGAFLSLPWRAEEPAGSVPAERPPEADAMAKDADWPPERERALYRRMAWTANFAAYGATGVLNHQLPKWFTTLGWGEGRFGLFLGAVFLSQTAAFALLGARVRFSYSVRRLLLPQAGACLVMLTLPAWRAYGILLALAPVLGFAFAMCYTASIYASLHTESGKGRFAGIHESLVGAGTFLMPLVGGLAVRIGGRLELPYLLSAAAILVAVGMQVGWWARLRTTR
jgi:MFS family permease